MIIELNLKINGKKRKKRKIDWMIIKTHLCVLVIDDDKKCEQLVAEITWSTLVKSSNIGRLSLIDTHVLIVGKIISDVINSHHWLVFVFVI
jgi:hypothetical protein